MLRKILLTFIALFTLSILVLTSNIFDTVTVEAEKPESVQKIWRFNNV